MAKLSPAAQAVRDAVLSTYADNVPKDERLWAIERNSVVAALRAAASASRRGFEHWQGMSPDDYENGWDAALDYIINLATELENHQ